MDEDEARVEQVEAIEFLEHAFRNIELPPLSHDDVEDIRDGLGKFARHRLATRLVLTAALNPEAEAGEFVLMAVTVIARLKTAAEEIRNDGHKGWGNVCDNAAQVIADAILALTPSAALRNAAKALVIKLAVVEDATSGIFSEMYARGRPYDGPTYGEELDALRRALELAPHNRRHSTAGEG